MQKPRGDCCYRESELGARTRRSPLSGPYGGRVSVLFDTIDSPHLRWAFTVNHAALVPGGIDGFLDQMGLARCEAVRLADSHGRYEEHLPPGEGLLDFRRLFRRIEQDPQFRGHYMCAFGSLEVMLAGRAYLAQEAVAALG